MASRRADTSTEQQSTTEIDPNAPPAPAEGQFATEGPPSEDQSPAEIDPTQTHNQAGVPQSAVLNQVPLSGAVHPDENVLAGVTFAERDVPGVDQKPAAERRAAITQQSNAATPELREREIAANQPVTTENAANRPLRPAIAPTRMRHDEAIDEGVVARMNRPELIAVMQQRGYEVNDLMGTHALREDFKRQQQDAFGDGEAEDESGEG